ncbi:MAG: YdeI/OmpD-associated family protein [Gordonia sp. (in: high G+C Gram-positive bacteria)]
MQTRPRHPMPNDVLAALTEAGVLDAYHERPPYQRNDYLGWIERAKRPETRAKRIAQMLAELSRGGVYMGMRHNASDRRDG